MAATDAVSRRIGTAEDLRSIVRTMKALAAANIRQYEEAVASLADYADAVALAFQALFKVRPDRLPRQPATRAELPRRGAIVLGTDHGLCGAFNERVTEFYLAHRAAARHGAHGPLLAVGMRVVGTLEDRGVRPDGVFAQPMSADRIAGLVLELLARIAAWRDAGRVDEVRLYYNAPHSRSGYAPREALLLPLDDDWLRRLAAAPWRPRALPTIAGDWEAVFAATVQQHLFVTLHGAIAQSQAGENASRLAAMHAAERNIEDRLHDLRGQFHRERQTVITTELLDIVSGYEVLTGRASRAAKATRRAARGRT
jgi:F-type H+-transporting ATPase subunit gamma